MLTKTQAREAKKALRRAVDLHGSEPLLARALSEHLGRPITHAHIWNWLNRDKQIPSDMAAPIELVTLTLAAKAKEPPVLRSDIRPDLYSAERPSARLRAITQTT